MNFEQILELLNDETKTRYQLAADIHALIDKAGKPSALNVKAIKERKKREPKAARVDAGQPATNGFDAEAGH